MCKHMRNLRRECSRNFGELSGGVLVIFWRILEASASFLEKVLKISAKVLDFRDVSENVIEALSSFRSQQLMHKRNKKVHKRV